jgi:hypothetical protein
LLRRCFKFRTDQSIIVADEEQYFNVSLSQIRRKLDGMRDSAVASSIWRPDFTTALAKYPHIQLTSLATAVAGCDACHLGGRLSTIQAQVSGEAYDRTTFEVRVAAG